MAICALAPDRLTSLKRRALAHRAMRIFQFPNAKFAVDDAVSLKVDPNVPPLDGRWVIYNGEAEASRVSPDWHGWLHHTWDEPPTKAPLKHKAWEKPHQENLTGTALAYAPDGSIRRPVPKSRADYEAWQPE